MGIGKNMDTRGQILSVNLLLMIIFIIIIIGVIIMLSFHINNRLIQDNGNYAIEHTSDEIIDTLINTPGSNDNWQYEYNEDIVPGLVVFDTQFNKTYSGILDIDKINMLKSNPNLMYNLISQGSSYNLKLVPIDYGEEIIIHNGISNGKNVISLSRPVFIDYGINHIDIIDDVNSTCPLGHDNSWCCKPVVFYSDLLDDGVYYFLDDGHKFLISDADEIIVDNSDTIYDLNDVIKRHEVNKTSTLWIHDSNLNTYSQIVYDNKKYDMDKVPFYSDFLKYNLIFEITQ
ncbi:MAG: hypothetical protein Q4Q23_01085 [Methanobacteriaceae archaeon]|nr:hypothetical protein [Methanobacteriaceae archaeon]